MCCVMRFRTSCPPTEALSLLAHLELSTQSDMLCCEASTPPRPTCFPLHRLGILHTPGCAVRHTSRTLAHRQWACTPVHDDCSIPVLNPFVFLQIIQAPDFINFKGLMLFLSQIGGSLVSLNFYHNWKSMRVST